jgi:hypothetical protein
VSKRDAVSIAKAQESHQIQWLWKNSNLLMRVNFGGVFGAARKIGDA